MWELFYVQSCFPSPYIVPPATIVNSVGQQTSAYTLILTFPLISYSQTELLIISTLTPADSAPIINDYPLSSQYSVTFNGLRTGVEYTYSVRIVLRSNTSVDVYIPLMRSFTLCKQCCAGLHVLQCLFVLLCTTTLSRCNKECLANIQLHYHYSIQ